MRLVMGPFGFAISLRHQSRQQCHDSNSGKISRPQGKEKESHLPREDGS